jgi:SM-20-related protein
MVNFYDDFLEEHIAQLIDMQLKDVSWKFDYDSVENGLNKHWHVFCGHDEESLREDISPIWQKIKKEWPDLQLERAYLNAHTHGIEPHIHRDDGAVTFIYYPRMDWKNEWGGGTVVYDNNIKNITDHVNYRGNRLIQFSAQLPHQAQPVSRECYQLRTCVVFKTTLPYVSNRSRSSFGLQT